MSEMELSLTARFILEREAENKVLRAVAEAARAVIDASSTREAIRRLPALADALEAYDRSGDDGCKRE